MSARYEIRIDPAYTFEVDIFGKIDVPETVYIDGPMGGYSSPNQNVIGAIRQQSADIAELSAVVALLTHKVICCGVAASHPNAALTTTGVYADKWDSPQAESVRKLRAERDQLRAELAAAVAERDEARTAYQVRNTEWHQHELIALALAERYKLRAEQAESRLAAIDAAPTVGWLRPYGRGLSTSEPSGERMPQYELIARPTKD